MHKIEAVHKYNGTSRVEVFNNNQTTGQG